MPPHTPAGTIELRTGEHALRVASDVSFRIKEGGLCITAAAGFSGLSGDWARFEEMACCSIFQSRAWAEAWCKTAAAASGEEPVFLVGRDGGRNLMFILPMARIRRFGVAMLGWLGQDHFSYNLGVFHRQLSLPVRRRIMAALPDAIRRLLPDIAGLCLKGQPFSWEGMANPLRFLPHQPSPVRAHKLLLNAPFKTLYERTFSIEKRSQHRRKARRLAEVPGYEKRIARTERERLHDLEAFFAQKRSQLESRNSPDPFRSQAARAFYRELAVNAPASLIEFQSQRINGEAAAVFYGACHRQRYYFLNISMADSEVRRWSPGFLLLRNLIERDCGRGIPVWDFGPGDGPHKHEWNTSPVPLFDSYVPLKPAGWLVCSLFSVMSWAKREIKARPVLLGFARRIRAWGFRGKKLVIEGMGNYAGRASVPKAGSQ